MTRRILLKVWSLVIAATIVALTMLACEIHIGPGTTTGETSDPAGSGGGSGFSPEEQAAIDAYENVDPAEARL